MTKKKFGALFLAMAMGVAAVGCSGGGESSQTESATETVTETDAGNETEEENEEVTGEESEEATEDATEDATDEETETEEETEGQPQDMTYTPSADCVKLLGRTYLYNDTLWLAYSASGIEFEVTGKSAEIVLYGDGTAMNATSDDGCARFAIYVNDELLTDEMMNIAAKNITLFEGDEEQTATVRLVKLSETANSTLGVHAINVEAGEIQPTEEKDLYIEFVGDSITCAYGVDDEDRSHHFSTTTEDATKSYAYKTVELLDADYSLVSISGYGVISGYTSGDKQENQIMSLYYDKIGFSYASSGGAYVSDWDWDFERQPDMVVINLGTNDSSYTGSDADKQQEFVEGYVEFIEMIREYNPDAYILCTLGLMGDTLYSSIEEAIEIYTEDTDDTNISAYHFDAITSDEGYAADWHPTEATHTRAAEELSAEISSILGLE